MSGRIEIWGGIECTVRRLGDEWDDQLERNGHANRLDDLDRLAALGLHRVRYPVLWERTSPSAADTFEWAWSDARLARLRELGLPPVVGLLHHGSGPRWTSLADPEFPTRFARYAGAVARRYPWVDAYTPINEPLTTARFSALYGHWYPHARDDGAFVQVLLRQCRATVLAMREIRRVRSDARLLQTEDLGAVHATAPLRYQADFENDRRWLTYDLLTGRVNRDHPLWSWLRRRGASERDLALAEADPCPPDFVGINYYVTSERFLDHRVAAHPSDTHGCNGRDRYADIAAVRAPECTPIGVAGLLRTTGDRYGLPVVISEAHLGCTRDDQVRWLAEMMRGAVTAYQAGVDIRALTVWSMLGAFDWASLLTRRDGQYEPGAFDVRSPLPRPTAIAKMTRALAHGEPYDHPVLDGAGWWVRGDARPTPRARRTLIIVGADSALGIAFRRVCSDRRLAVCVADSDTPGCTGAWGVVDARQDGGGPLVPLSAAAKLPLLVFSSDEVFDGTAQRPYVESDEPSPVTPLGRWLAARERAAQRRAGGSLIVRTGPLIGDGLEAPEGASVAGSPSFLDDLINASLDLLIDGAAGIWHLVNPSPPPVSASMAIDGRRCRTLDSERATLMPSLEDVIRRCPHLADMQLPGGSHVRA